MSAHPSPPASWSSRPGIRILSTMTLAFVALLALLITALASPAAATPAGRHPVKPTVVLVHGAFADASSWTKVVTRLQGAGYPVIAPANPLRDLAGDSAYLSSVLSTIDGPVVLVGHSYGGAVISNAATGHPNVKALVFIAAFAPEETESALDLTGRFPGSRLPTSLITRPYPLPGGGTGTDTYIDPAAFRAAFAADLPGRDTVPMAATQRPAALAALGSPSGPPAWKTIASWYLVAGADQAIPPAAQRFMAERAGAHTSEARDASHVIMISRPDMTAAVIMAAARTTG
ncbi:alpha/beta hydrolase [Sphaerisporangium rufum]|uniref:Alpha/beta hydrolase n=1 Tax=Sphaerisporangium rufum TaxID=1381558 RepID=A0A919R455_9ACTN|nr:alpha/beta hydrolase [Sphaerisporangium rufum]GII78963.1 alpha/beta hydrolase [Sphaerisporangium rufum]